MDARVRPVGGIASSFLARTLGVAALALFIGAGFMSLGHRSAFAAEAPREIEGLRVTQVDLGRGDSAAIAEDGSLWMWGRNEKGQLGDGTTEDRYEPVKIMNGVRSVSLGGYHSAAVKEDGSLWTWGSNSSGQLGDSTTEDCLEPVKVMDNVSSVSLGDDHSAAITEDGSLWMWGSNSGGACGANSDVHEPFMVMANVKSVSLGDDYSAAVKEDGSLWTWGFNLNGQLGDGTTSDFCAKPIKIMDNVSSVSLGDDHSAAITEDGSLWTWGVNYDGRLGDGTTEDRLTPVRVMGGVATVSLGGVFSAAVTEDGSLWMWGDNTFGQLGDGTNLDHREPAKVMGGVASVSLGGLHSAAITEDGSLWTWGYGDEGQLGNGYDHQYAREPVRIPVGVGSTVDPDPEPEPTPGEDAVTVESRPEDTKGADLKLDGGVDVDIPDDVPIVGGEELALDFKLAKVKFKREDNTYKIAIGVEDMSKLEENWEKFKKFVETQDENIEKGLKGLSGAQGGTVVNKSLDVEMSIYGYAEGTIAEGGIQTVEGKLSIGIKGKGKWEGQFVVVVVPVVVTFSGEAGVKATGGVGVDLDEGEVYFDAAAEMTLPKIKATAGVGIAHVADVGVYGSGKNVVSYEGGKENSLTVTLSGEIGLRARALFVEYEKAILKGEWEYPDDTKKGRSAAGSAGAAGSSEGWSGIERDIAGAWTGSRRASRSRASSGGTTSPGAFLLQLQSSVYDGAEPQMLETDSGARAIIYTLDQEGMPDAYSTTPYISVYDLATGTWREPVPLLGKDAIGYDATYCVVGDTVWVAQVEPGTPLTSDQLALPVEEQLSIAVSGSSVVLRSVEVSQDGSVVLTGESAVLSNPGAGGLMPSVEACELGDGSEELVVSWVENPAHDPLGMSGENIIHSATYAVDGGSLVKRASSSTSCDAPVTEVAAGRLGNSLAVAYIEDVDGDLSTTADRALRAVDAENSVDFGVIGVGASNLQFARIGVDDCLAWYDTASGSIFYSKSADEGSEEMLASGDSISPDFSFVDGEGSQLLLTCETRDEEGGSDLVARRLDSDGSGGVAVGGPVALTDESGYVSDATGLPDGDGWDVVLLRSDVTIGGEEVASDGEGQVSQVANLCVLDTSEIASPELVSTELSLYGGESGDVPTVTVEVVNDGLAATNAGKASISLDGSQVATLDVPAMAPGEMRTLEIPAPTLAGTVAAGDEVRVSLDMTGATPSSATVEAGLVDFTLVAEGGPDGVSYEVGNDGTAASDATLEVRNEDAEGALLASYSLGNIAPGSEITGSVEASEVASWKASDVCLVVVPVDVDDACEGDNAAFIYASEEGTLGASLDHIRVSLPDASFEAGEPLDLSGMEVTAVLEDGTEVASGSYTTNAAEIDTSEPGEAELVVACRYAERTAAVAVPIEIVGGPEVGPGPDPAPATQDMYRLYNRYTGEHFYTASAYERDSLSSVGWDYEGVGWTAPASGDPVYRLYNPYAPGGDHHYTTSARERDALVAEGWSYEGVGWRSAAGGADRVPLYRQYNPYASTGTHNYTASLYENDHLVSLGWRAEGVAWYGVG